MSLHLRTRRLPIGVLWLVSLTLAGIAAGPAGAQDSNLLRVGVVDAKRTDYARTLMLTGDIQAQKETSVAFQIGEKLTALLANIGDRVKPGDILARVESPEHALAVASAKAALSGAQAQVTITEADLQRQTRLFQGGVASRSQLEAAQQQTASATAGARSASVALALAEEQMGYAELRADKTGTILTRGVEVGQVVLAGQTAFLVADDGGRDAVFDLFETAVVGLPLDFAVQLTLLADPKIAANGHLRELSPLIDATSGTVKVKIGIDTPPPEMTLGAAVTGTATVVSPARFVVAKGAISSWQGKPAVWILDSTNNQVRPVVVTLDRYSTESIILTGGLAPGDRVVVAGNQFLNPGQTVEPVPENTP